MNKIRLGLIGLALVVSSSIKANPVEEYINGLATMFNATVNLTDDQLSVSYSKYKGSDAIAIGTTLSLTDNINLKLSTASSDSS